MENRINLNDGYIKQNIVFMSGLFIAPVIACASTLLKALAVCYVFSFVSLVTIAFCRFIPRTIVYTIRVILYSAAASVVYIPAAVTAEGIFGQEIIASAGVYLPIIVTNSLILSKTQTRFYIEPVGNMLRDAVGFIIGFDWACILTGLLRELLSVGRIAGAQVSMPFTIPALETTFGGFLFVGIGAGIFRAIYNYSRKKAAQPEPEDGEESLAEYAEDMGEFLVGRKRGEKIRIYRAAAKKAKSENDLLDMDFLSNRDIVAALEEIVAQGQEMTAAAGDERESDADAPADSSADKSENEDKKEV